MYCPFCQMPNTKVVDSRYSAETNKVRRRRECESCSQRFTTYEMIEYSFPMLVKVDGRRESFKPDKVRSGINRAIEKRPVTAEQVDQIVAEVETQLRRISEKEIPVSQVGEFVMDALKKLDEVAYVRFASVYRSFQDVNAFQVEIDKLQKFLKKHPTNK